MRKLIFVVLFAFLGSFFGTTILSAQNFERHSVEGKLQLKEKNRGTEVKIKSDMPTADAPLAKPEKTRGENTIASISVDNYTGYTLKVWVNWDFKGVVSPFGKGILYDYTGTKTIYIESYYGTYFWGPWDIYLGYNGYEVNIYE